MFMQVLPRFVVKWTTDDESMKTVGGLEHQLVVFGSDELSRLLGVISKNAFRSLIVESYDPGEIDWMKSNQSVNEVGNG